MYGVRKQLLILFTVASLLATLAAPSQAEEASGSAPGHAGAATRAVDDTADIPTPADLGIEAGSPWLLPPEFDARPGLNQIFVTEADPGDMAQLWRWRRTAGVWGAIHVETVSVDAQGAAMFRELKPGYFIVASGGRVNWSLAVGSTDDPAPQQSFYADQELIDGFQYIETRDGTLLSANVVLPGPIEDGPYPTVVEYSGYDPSNPNGSLGALVGGGPAQPSSLIASLFGYAVVGVNVRGSGCSGGAYDFFEDMQVLDGYDAIEAVAAQPWVLNNKVGMVGLSYPGIAQFWVAKSHPPSLASIAPVSVYGDTATGILGPGGLLNTGFATSWADQVLNNSRPNGTGWVRDLIADGDTTCEANQLLRLQNVDATEKARDFPFYTSSVAKPLDIRSWVRGIDVPVFLASAFQDEQTGPSFGELLGRFDSSPSVHATIYNGLHGDGFAPQILREWAAFLDIYVAEQVPSLPPDAATLTAVLSNAIYGGNVPLPPDRWADVSTHAEAKARWESEDPIKILFESGAGGEHGLPQAAWSYSTDDWPPPATTTKRLFLDADGDLTDAAPTGPEVGVSIVPNPAVSQTSFHNGGDIWHADPTYQWIPQVEGENARFQTKPLLEDLLLTGTASVDLWVQTDAVDAELEAVLSEVHPDGNEVRVQSGVLQASYRGLHWRATELNPIISARERDWAELVPGEWTQMRIQIPAFAHAFRAGSSLRVTLNTPGGDHATWEFELDGPGAEATHVIGTSAEHASSIALPELAGVSVPSPLPACGALRGQPCRTAPAIANVVVQDAPPTEIGPADRPATVVLPTDYDPNQEYPVVMVLHGFGASGFVQSAYFGATGQVDERDFILIQPDGTQNAQGTRFWATGASCCGTGVDDSGYLSGLIDEALATYSADADRVYLWGHSNGGFMSYTMACEHADQVAAIASLAGSSFLDEASCAPSEPIAVLQLHGDADATISYDPNPGVYPGALEMFDRFAGLNSCPTNAVQTRPNLDIDTRVDGAETSVQFIDGCADDTAVELWTIEGGGHIPLFTPNHAPDVLDWLFSHSNGTPAT